MSQPTSDHPRKQIVNVGYGSTATRLFTASSELRNMAHGWLQVELHPPATVRASLYRESGKKPGWFSREYYEFTEQGWIRVKKDKEKFQTAPAPSAKIKTQILTFQVISHQPLTEQSKELLRKSLSLFPNSSVEPGLT